MPPKKKHDGILSCDPSFKGMAFSMYLPGLSYQDARCYDIREDRKIYDTQEMTRELVYKNLCQLRKDMPLSVYCSIFVIEGQFKKKMIRLQEAVCNQVRVMFPEIKIITIPAYSTRKFFGTNTESYYQNKKESINFLKRNPQLLVAELWSNNDNICEAIILLNHLVQKQALELHEAMSYSYSQQPNRPDCPTCKQPAGSAMSTSEKNPNRPYWKCENRDCEKYQQKKAFLAFYGEEDKIGKPFTGKTNKRPIETNPNVSLVPAAKKVPPQIPQYQQQGSKSSAPHPADNSLKLFTDMVAKITRESQTKTIEKLASLCDMVELVLKRTEKLDYFDFDNPQPIGDADSNHLTTNENLGEYGVNDQWQEDDC